MINNLHICGSGCHHGVQPELGRAAAATGRMAAVTQPRQQGTGRHAAQTWADAGLADNKLGQSGGTGSGTVLA